MSANEFAVTADGLVKRYKDVAAVDGLRLRVPRGAIYGLLGRNGAGKTTAIRMMMSLARPAEGELRVLGRDPQTERVEVLKRVGYVPDVKELLMGTAEKLVALNRGFYPETWSDAHAEKYARRLEIPMKMQFAKLSLGNKTKVWLLLALAQRSELLVLDEPTSGLDPVAIDELLRILVEDCTENGRTVFLSSHQLPEIEKVCDWVGIIQRGKMLLEERLDDVRERYRRVTAAGAGLPEQVGGQVLAVSRDAEMVEYLVSGDAEGFAAELMAHGAAVSDVSPVSLTEIFLKLCRPEGV